MYYSIQPTTSDLQHHGVLGMKWGVRRYQNADGSLTEKGKKKYTKIANQKKYPDSAKKAIMLGAYTGATQLAIPVVVRMVQHRPISYISKKEWISAGKRAVAVFSLNAGLGLIQYKRKAKAKEILAKNERLENRR